MKMVTEDGQVYDHDAPLTWADIHTNNTLNYLELECDRYNRHSSIDPAAGPLYESVRYTKAVSGQLPFPYGGSFR